jgi:hypothetical protein
MDHDSNMSSGQSPVVAAALTAGIVMADSSSSGYSDVLILGVGLVLAAVYLFKDNLFSSKAKSSLPAAINKTAHASNGSGNPRDFVSKMKEGVRLSFPLLPASY